MQFTHSGPVNLTVEQAVRRYSVIHAETEAARARWDAETEEAAQSWADALPDTPQALVAGTAAAQPTGSKEVVAPTLGAQVTISQEVASPPPPSAAQELAPVTPTSQEPTTTQSVASMLQSFAFEDTRSGYYDDYDLDYPQN